ncbi:MAG: AAA family ATPase, partial [Acidimicrobiales bacterium]
MRVERVDAVAFGPLSSAVLELPEAMTIVFGPNEAGKSSWAAALYAGMCGTRRARGRRHAEEDRFEQLHRPWKGGPWRAGAVVCLSDGRRIELDQDLATRTGRARDADTGKDLTPTILTDQVPDASRYLGLDRYAFEAVAWLSQGEMLAILDHPERLAEHLQRAAATAGVEATAAEALKGLGEFLAERVGTERATTRPLAKAIVELDTTEDVLEAARVAHDELAELSAEVLRIREQAGVFAHRLAVTEAAVAARQAERAAARLTEASTLASRHVVAQPSLLAEDALAQEARLAIEAWENRPAEGFLQGPSAAELAEELSRLPTPPEGDTEPGEGGTEPGEGGTEQGEGGTEQGEGDTEPAAEVIHAADALRDAQSGLSSLSSLEPARPEPIDSLLDPF